MKGKVVLLSESQLSWSPLLQGPTQREGGNVSAQSGLWPPISSGWRLSSLVMVTIWTANRWPSSFHAPLGGTTRGSEDFLCVLQAPMETGMGVPTVLPSRPSTVTSLYAGMGRLHRPLTGISRPEVASGLCDHICLPTAGKGTAPHLKHCKVCSSDAVFPHSPVLSIHKQKWRNRGQGGVWYEGGRLVLQPVILNHIVILSGCIGSAPRQLSLECRVPQCLLSAALVWTLATILRH